MNKSNGKNSGVVILLLLLLLMGFVSLSVFVQSNLENGINPEKMSPTITSSNGINAK